jgi:hypothetical protein
MKKANIEGYVTFEIPRFADEIIKSFSSAYSATEAKLNLPSTS